MTGWQMVGIAWLLVGVMFLPLLAVGEWRDRTRARRYADMVAEAGSRGRHPSGRGLR